MQSSTHFSPIQTHYMSCLKCDMRFESRSGNKARLREVLAKHMADAHDVSATCPTCYKVFNSSNKKRANQNSMEQHQQVKIVFAGKNISEES